MPCIVIRDGFGDIHAKRIDGRLIPSPHSVEWEARVYIDDMLPLDDGEEVDYGLADTNDPEAARLQHVPTQWYGKLTHGEWE